MAQGKYDTGKSTHKKDEITKLDEISTKQDIKPLTPYYAVVNNCTDFGIFVTLREKPSEISGLVHISNLPPKTTIDSFSEDDEIAVKLDKKKPNGDLSFIGIQKLTESDEIIDSTQVDLENEDDLTKRIEKLEKEISSDNSNGDSIPEISSPIENVRRKLTDLNQKGFDIKHYNLLVDNNDSKVKIEVTLEK